MAQISELSWLLPLSATLILLAWIWRGRPATQDQQTLGYSVLLMRAGGGIPLSGALWLIWWLVTAL